MQVESAYMGSAAAVMVYESYLLLYSLLTFFNKFPRALQNLCCIRKRKEHTYLKKLAPLVVYFISTTVTCGTLIVPCIASTL